MTPIEQAQRKGVRKLTAFYAFGVVGASALAFIVACGTMSLFVGVVTVV